jgi:hypothetical protein
MIYFMLGLLVCNGSHYSDCHWVRHAARFVSEQHCAEVGSNYQLRDEQVIRYKCVVQMDDEHEPKTPGPLNPAARAPQ